MCLQQEEGSMFRVSISHPHPFSSHLSGINCAISALLFKSNYFHVIFTDMHGERESEGLIMPPPIPIVWLPQWW